MIRHEHGRMGEELARTVFADRGWVIIEQNYCCKGGELDFVATKDDVLAFVEVRACKRDGMVLPVETITPKKRKRIITAAYNYLYRNPHLEEFQPRFDLFLIIIDGDTPDTWEWEHMAGAFDTSDIYCAGSH